MTSTEPLTRTATSHLALRVPDLAEAVDFYGRALGLSPEPQPESAPDATRVRLGWGRGHHVLELTAGEAGLDHFGFEVGESDRLAELRDSLHAANCALHELDPLRFGAPGFAVTDPDGNEVHFHTRVDRSGEVADPSAHRPVRFQHITLAAAHVSEMLSFYVDTVGFRRSDIMGEDEFTWLRSNAEHHTLALVAHPAGAGLDHFAFEVSGWDEIKMWCDRLTSEGIDITWGPGRHGPGNNLFVFFDDPFGHHIELSAELETFHDDLAAHPVRRWRPIPRTPNLWGGQLTAIRQTSQAGG